MSRPYVPHGTKKIGNRYLKAANGQLHASESDRTGRNLGMTRLARRSGAISRGTAFFSLVQTLRQRKRKCSGSPIRTIPKRDVGFYKELTFQLILQE